jgi:putative peptidoglycan lipid II flippase
VGGLALGTTVALTINFFVLLYLLRRRIGPMGLGRLGGSFVRVTAASAAMGIVIWALDFGLSQVVGETTGGNAVRVVVGLAAGIFVYLIASKLMRSPELAEVKDMLRAVLRRSG